MRKQKHKKSAGFSLVEFLVAATVMLVLLGLVSGVLANVLGTRTAESRKTDALTSAQAALNVISRELANSGFGLTNNGLVPADSTAKRLHFRANINNADLTTTSPGEDITYFYDAATQSIVRYDRYASPQTSVVVNGISDVTFSYWNYAGAVSTPTGPLTTPSAATGRVTITVLVRLENVAGQPRNQTVTFTSDVTLRNSSYMLNQY